MTPYYEHAGISIYNADCRDVEVSADVLVTDPPYGVSIGKHSGAKEKRRGLLQKAGGHDDSPETFSDVVVPRVASWIQKTRRAAVFGVPPTCWLFPPPDAIGGVFVAGACGRNRWGWSNLIHCLLYGSAPNLNKGAKPTAIAKTATAEKTGHPVAKPLVWMRWVVSLAAQADEVVIDPFMGSGTTLVAAKDMGLKAIGVEISERYCEIAARRLAQDVISFGGG